jgi:hypothetical protein
MKDGGALRPELRAGFRYIGETVRGSDVLLGLCIRQVSQNLAAFRYSNWSNSRISNRGNFMAIGTTSSHLGTEFGNLILDSAYYENTGGKVTQPL